MNDILYYFSQDSVLKDIIIWAILLTIVIVMVILLLAQVRHSRQLKEELAELGKVHEHNIEYEFVLKAMNLAVWHIDPKTKSLVFDQDFRVKGNMRSTQFDGSAWEESTNLLHENDAERVKKALGRICLGETDEYHESYRVLTPYSNKKFYWEESYAIVAERDVEGKPTRIVGTCMPIDERKEMEEALMQARNRAEESDRLKSAFIANMSHEIRTPLNAIIGFTSVLPDVGSDEERKGLLDLIQENTQKLLRIIDDVVNISKAEAAQDELTLSAFELNDTLTDQMAQNMSHLNMGVKLDSHFGADTLVLNTDRVKFTEIISHLLSNAMKFTLQGNVTVGYDAPADGFVRIWVSDTGKGISEENLAHVFERFYKVDEFVPGAGLGLSVCRTMTERLGGKIGAESRLGEGSTFWFTIPV